MASEFIKSRRGKYVLVRGGFIYKIVQEGEEKFIWS